MRTLPASEIKVGHCVIINDVECPEGRMVSVITGFEHGTNGGTVITQYLSSRKELDGYNRRGVFSPRCTVSPVGWFGVTVFVNSDMQYWCEKTGESRATYRDGKPRQWQESCPVKHVGRIELLGLSLLQNSEAGE